MEEDTDFQYLKNYVEKVQILNNPNVNELFLKMLKKPMSNIPKNKIILTNFFCKLIMLQSINQESYDNKFQKYLSLTNLNYFIQLNKLIDACIRKEQQKTIKVMKKFLSLDMIKNLRFNPAFSTSEGLTNSFILDLKEKYQNSETIDYTEIAEEMRVGVEKIHERTEDLLKQPHQLKKEFEEILESIKDYYELLKYFLSFLIALFDITEERLKSNLDYYFKTNKIVSEFFGLIKKNNKTIVRKNSLIYYIHLKKYQNKYSSIGLLYQEWFMDNIRHIRNHGAHKKDSVEEIGFIDHNYKIKIQGQVKTFAITEIKELESKIHQFYLWNKGLIAKNYFNNDQELFNYLTFKN